MKKVILENKKEEVYLSDLNEDSIVGLMTSFKDKFLFIKTNKGYELIGDYSFNSEVRVNYKSVEDAIEKGDTVYKFDTMKELFKWLSED